MSRVTVIGRPKYSPKEHQKQGDSGQILTICECWKLEGCNYPDSQSDRNHIDDLWKRIQHNEATQRYVIDFTDYESIY